MMSLKFAIGIQIVQIVLAGAPFRIPVIFDDSGVPFVDSRIESLNGSEVVRMRLSTGTDEFSDRSLRHHMRARIFSRHEVSLLSLNETSTRFITHFFHLPYGQNVIETGPNSDIVETFGSVAFVNESPQSAFLQLGDSYENFVDNYCLPGSEFTIEMDMIDCANGFISGFIPDGTDDADERHGRIIYFNSDVAPDRQIVSLPQGLYDRIESTIRSHSSHIVSESPRLIFDDCQAVRAQLDPIDILFFDIVYQSQTFSWGPMTEREEVVKVRLRFDSIDFTEIVQLNDTCELVLQNSNDSTMTINLFMLKDINFRYTNDRLTICDSSL